MIIYILSGYDSIFDTNEIKAVFFSHANALIYRKKHGYALEEHETEDEPLTDILNKEVHHDGQTHH